ncbi:FkbM family methyltransferase [Litchfieldella rifensis]|uniref:FkbM family methyltransferase n=1 Tax=Litchfieldella rifensis TaxID=762643 RepID=A0ABV7LJ75_9GAMM
MAARDSALPTRLRGWLGLTRSLTIYWRPGRQRALRELYGEFLAPGDLAFDIGAHLGDRSAAFAALGARVVALEPHPQLFRWLTRLVGHHVGITLLPQAAGAECGQAELAVSHATPTVSTLASDWWQHIGQYNAGFREVCWETRLQVPVTTLDTLIAAHGRPTFCKIDVEGFEAQVLAGLSQPLSAVSVEFVTGALDVARDCVDRLMVLGEYEFNAIAGERRTFLWPRWQSAVAIHAWLRNGVDGLASGDLYARLISRENAS